MKYLVLLSFLFSSVLYAQIGRRISEMKYHHATVGTTAQDAISAGSVDRNIKGWKICHDAGSASSYLSISVGADPDADGIRIGANSCYDCLECGSTALINANVKASAASTGYSVLQLK